MTKFEVRDSTKEPEVVTRFWLECHSGSRVSLLGEASDGSRAKTIISIDKNGEIYFHTCAELAGLHTNEEGCIVRAPQ